MCREFVEAAKQRRCDRSCLRCTSAAVMFPPWTQEEESEHMGAGSESQPAGSLHVTAQICCFLMHKRPPLPLPKTVSLRLRHYKTNLKNKQKNKRLNERIASGDTLRHTGCHTERMSISGFLLN